jgi:hypothetical protein
MLFTLICFCGAAKNFFQYHVLSDSYECEIIACDFYITVFALTIIATLFIGLCIAFVNRIKKDMVG